MDTKLNVDPKFTAGPWQAVAGTTTGKRVISLAAVAKSRTTVAHVGGPDRDANALALAAVPRLYAALHRIAVLSNRGEIETLSDEAEQALNEADAACAEAVGMDAGAVERRLGL